MKKKRKAIPGQIELGDLVRDTRSGFTGIAEVVSEFLYQCRQISVRPEGLDKEQKMPAPQWFDEPQLELLQAGVVKPSARVMEAGVAVSGGPERARAPQRSAR